ncbi:MAG: cytochrome c biogenesis protein ResB [Betaproteobacteria bacterium]
MKTFFLSLKTTVWTLFVLICLFFIGSYMMPAHREVFGPMNDDILFAWVENTASGSLWYTWWFFAALAGLALLTVNTLVCSVQAVKGKWTRDDFLLRISPQVIHIGFLFILLAHLLGAGWGYKVAGALPEGSYARLPEGRTVFLRSIRADVDSRGIPKGWSAEVTLFDNNEQAASGTLGPNQPLLYQGMGIYMKSFELEPRPYAFLLVAKDPGAIWALVGGVLFMLGSMTLLTLKWKRA